MFTEMHHADRTYRAMDLAEKIADRRRHALVARTRISRRARLTRRLFAVVVTTGSPQVEGRA
jgi:hypothetical protein